MAREVEVSPKSGERKPITDETGACGNGDGRIKCPLCGWTPAAHHLWMCSCRYLWNTFDTGGVCPKCLKQWTETACLECHQWSPHSAWYPAI